MRLIPHLRTAVSVAVLAAFAASSLAQTVDGKPQVKSQVLDRVTSLLSTQAYVPGLDFEKWKEFSDAQKAKLDSSKDDEEFGYAVNEAFSKFGASHIALITPKYTTLRTTGSIVGIGITQQKTEDGTLILRTVPGAAADKAGLVPGDIITKVEGKPADGAIGIAGGENTKVRLTVKHANGSSAEYTLTRTKFSAIRPEELLPVDGDTARLVISTFDLSYDRDNVESLMRKAASYKNLIVDLRDNGGGAVKNVQHFLGTLLPRTAFGTYVDKAMVDAYVEKTGGKPTDVVKIAEWSRGSDNWNDDQVRPFHNRNVPIYPGHLAVLVNRFSGSGSEIAAAALRDLAGAQIVGTKSAGAVLVSYIVPVSNGFSLEFPIMDYVTVKGLRLEGNGVAPVAEVADPKYRIANAKDPVVDKATSILESSVLSASKL